jgi:DNA-binding transcriptional MocR family regulator
MDSDTLVQPEARSRRLRDSELSYKFERLRERIRAAVNNGELSGKLPGERVLARRFRVNAKTLSKALTDLAAEGVLELMSPGRLPPKPRRHAGFCWRMKAPPAIRSSPNCSASTPTRAVSRWRR